MALSCSVADRHSRTPVRSDRSAAGDDPVPGLLNDRKRGRAAERGRHGVGEEAVRLRIGRDARVRVDVHDTRQHQQPGGIDDLARAPGDCGQVGLDGADPIAADGDIRSLGSGRPDDGATEDDEVRSVRHSGQDTRRAISRPACRR